MSRRYTYSRAIQTPEGLETFSAEQFDSFEEAKKAVDKGIYDRKLEIEKTHGPQSALKNPTVPKVEDKKLE